MLFCVGNFFGNDDTEWQQVISGTINGERCCFNSMAYTQSALSCTY